MLLTVIKLPAVPSRLKLDTVWVVPDVKLTVAGWTLLVMSLKVLEPLIVNVPTRLG